MFGFESSETDAIALLRKDHRVVEKLFAQLEGEGRGDRRIAVVASIVQELTVHARLEEELFYPLALVSLDDQGQELIWEATVEHGTLSGLIEALEAADADDESFDAHLKVLKEYVQHHVREEENRIFPRVRMKTDIDLDSLGKEMSARRKVLKEMYLDANHTARPSARSGTAPRAAAA